MVAWRDSCLLHPAAMVAMSCSAARIRSHSSSSDRDAFETLDKAAKLKMRDLPRYMKQLSLSKLECERRLAALGRPDFKSKTETSRTDCTHAAGVGGVTQQGKRGLFGGIKSLINMTGAPGANSVAFLSLPEILGDGIALGYLFDYLRKARALKNLQFWLACLCLVSSISSSLSSSSSSFSPYLLVYTVFRQVHSIFEPVSALTQQCY